MLLLLGGCGTSINTDPLEITSKKSKNHKHVFEGVWIKQPSYYKPADSFYGFRTPYLESSISVTTSDKSLDHFKSTYTKENLRRKNLDPLEIRELKVNGKNGLYLVVEDKRKQIIKYKMLIEVESELIEVEAYFITAEMGYQVRVENALHSIYIGEKEKMIDKFQLVLFDNAKGSIIYTTDGEYPTQSEDGLTIEEFAIENTKAKLPKQFIEDEMKRSLGRIPESWSVSNFEGGKIYMMKGKHDGKSAIVFFFMFNANNKGFIVSCTGNDRMNLLEVEQDVRNKYLKLTLQ